MQRKATRKYGLGKMLLAGLCAASFAFDLWLIGGDLSVWMIPAALAGWYVADLISGLVHMYMDYRPCIPGTGLKDLYFWEGPRNTPTYRQRQAEVYGRISRFERVVYDFKKHHPMPDLLGRNGVANTVPGPMLVVLPGSIALNILFWLTDAPGWLILAAVVMFVGSIFSQYFHATLHREERAPVVLAMRRVGLLMTPDAHKYHHETLVRDFSVISGWSNPVVNVCVRTLLKMRLLREEGLEPT